ncbi:MAG: NUDIX hydrolase [Candidatus Woesearchaeota archaeon]
MGVPKDGVSSDGRKMHYSVGAVIKQAGKYLLIDRAVEPFGFAGPAGHVDEGESPEDALKREVEEEVGLKIVKHGKLYEEEFDWNWCSKGVNTHYWYLFECDVEGELSRSFRETKSAGWYTEEEIKGLKLEPVWEHWFRRMGVIE